MEKSYAKRHVAVIENCIMSEAGLSHLFNSYGLKSFQLHFFKDYAAFKSESATINFMAIIFSLPGLRAQRITCLHNLVELTCANPTIKRIVLANDDTEARLMSLLSPSPTHGVISKDLKVKELKDKLSSALNETQWISDDLPGEEFTIKHCGLSPTEREILHYMTYGYSLPEIAHHLSRNIKTVRAHKFNAMTKLGVHSDAGLLDAADILMHITTDKASFSAHAFM
ncbi:DNA-binding transcriptional activator BglJ [Enterobacter sp.]|uniref:DNA-binding transcriptional activator BglJ n=1 Tax=Enterobacter sp. TaxID=42895 RepID=UPI00296E94EB|nr:DNA-binding transcriptional activator BglJ [Enterobacter sp.]